MADSGIKAVFLAQRLALLRFVRARGGGADSEDVLQELWIKVSELTAPGPIANPLSYLYRMADNLMHDRARSAGRQARREQNWSDMHSEDIAPSRATSIERSVLARDQLRLVERRLAALGERTRHVFQRFRIDGVQQGQIAREEGISLSAVEKHLQRAYRALAAAVVDGEDDAETHRQGRL